jgi:hypothetical protein
MSPMKTKTDTCSINSEIYFLEHINNDSLLVMHQFSVEQFILSIRILRL